MEQYNEIKIKPALRHGRFRNKHDEMSNSSDYTQHIIQNDKKSAEERRVVLQGEDHVRKSKGTKLAIKGYGRSGPILSRSGTGAVPVAMKRWSNSYWLHVYPATIQTFDSEEKMARWKELAEEDQRNGENEETMAEKKKLVRSYLNFDTEGILQKKIDRYESNQVSATKGFVSGLTSRNSKVEDDMAFRLPMKYVMEEVRSKYYTRKGPLIHGCKISYLDFTGRNLVAAFGSEEPNDLKRLRGIIRYCIRLVRKAAPKKKKSKYARADESTIGESLISGMNKSAITSMSNTAYGEKTMDEKTLKRFRRSKQGPNGSSGYSHPSAQVP